MKKVKAPAPKRLQKPNIAARLLALAVTTALVLGALVLVVYRDTYNLDSFKRWLASRIAFFVSLLSAPTLADNMPPKSRNRSSSNCQHLT